MSRIGRLIIDIPSGVTVTPEATQVHVSGPKGQLDFVLPTGVKVVVDNNQVKVEAEASNLQGLTRAIVANMVTGVNTGWTKVLELNGTGYRASTNGTDLNLALGFSHPVVMKAPQGISFKVEENKITVAGADRAMVGEVAAKVRALRPADPYKIKGFKYEGEVIIKKAGKAAKAGATK